MTTTKPQDKNKKTTTTATTMNQEHNNNKTTITTMNQKGLRTQQLQKPWLLTVNKMSHMLCHSGWPRHGDVEVVVV